MIHSSLQHSTAIHSSGQRGTLLWVLWVLWFCTEHPGFADGEPFTIKRLPEGISSLSAPSSTDLSDALTPFQSESRFPWDFHLGFAFTSACCPTLCSCSDELSVEQSVQPFLVFFSEGSWESLWHQFGGGGMTGL